MAARTLARYADFALFTALLATAVALAAGLAHVFAFPNKITMSRDAYYVAQRIYDGWSLIGLAWLVEWIGLLATLALHRRGVRVRGPTVLALAAFVLAQAAFWIWTYPVNQLTANWTAQPENWQALRLQWEVSHVAGAAFQLIAMSALVVAALRRRRE